MTIEKALVGSRYDNDLYLATPEQEAALREFWNQEDKLPENMPIKADLYGDDARFGGALSGKERPRNQAEYQAYRCGQDYIALRKKNWKEAKERWAAIVEKLGLEKWRPEL